MTLSFLFWCGEDEACFEVHASCDYEASNYPGDHGGAITTIDSFKQIEGEPWTLSEADHRRMQEDAEEAAYAAR